MIFMSYKKRSIVERLAFDFWIGQSRRCFWIGQSRRCFWIGQSRRCFWIHKYIIDWLIWKSNVRHSNLEGILDMRTPSTLGFLDHCTWDWPIQSIFLDSETRSGLHNSKWFENCLYLLHWTIRNLFLDMDKHYELRNMKYNIILQIGQFEMFLWIREHGSDCPIRKVYKNFKLF